MKEYQIYTAGKMSGLGFAEQMEWRTNIERSIRHALADRDNSCIVQFVHPPYYYTYGSDEHKTEREIKEWDTTRVMQSNIVIVNTDHVNDSTGTHYELAMCDAINRLTLNHIFVIGVGETKPEDLHPWIAESIMRYEQNIEDAAAYITDYLLI